MERRSAIGALRQIGTLYNLGTLGGLPDSRLLELFLARDGDAAEDAFAALVDRHGPTVLGVCRRMLRSSHDAEDAFQATFLVLARRAGSIGRREQLASWLYGVAVRTAKEARRRAARAREIEMRMRDVSRVESAPAEHRDDGIRLLDEELNRLPHRFRVALVACELEGKSRREAAQQLGIPEGTLSAHLARGRKLLRDRLLRRGVDLGLGPIAGLSRPIGEAAIPDRLMAPTVRAALGYASGTGAAGAVPAAVESLARRVLKMMFLTRLTLIVATLMAATAGTMAAAVFGLTTLAARPAPPDPIRAGTNDLPGRVVSKAGAGVADVQVWAVGGLRYQPVTVASTTTNAQGRFVLPKAWEHKAAKATGDERLGLFARARDGRVGWLAAYRRDPGADGRAELELVAIGEVRGRVTDQDGRPIAGATVAADGFWKPNDSGWSDYLGLIPEVASTYRTNTAPDGSYILRGIPQGALIEANITAQGFGTPWISWDSAQAATIALDNRLGRIEGFLKPSDARGFSGSMRVYVRRAGSLARSTPGSVTLRYNAGVQAGNDGSFRFDGLPPGRYAVSADPQDNTPFVAKPVEEAEVGPNGVARVEIPIDPLVTIKGRILDAQTGKGVTDIAVGCYRLENQSLGHLRSTTTDKEGRYSVLAQPGTVQIRAEGLPKTYLFPSYADHPDLEVKADRTWPDLKVTPVVELEGIVVDATGRPAAGAEVHLITQDLDRRPLSEDSIRTGPDGTFHYDQIDPDRKLALWARAGDATTSGTVVVRPREVKGKLTLTIDPQVAFRLRGNATDSAGKPIAGATVTLHWNRWHPTENDRPMLSARNVLETYTTGESGQFDFRGLWPDLQYNIVIEARGHNKAEAPRLTGKAGQTQDIGKLVLVNTTGHLAGRVVGSDGLPIAGAAVFNRGDSPEPVATSTDAQGRFRLEGLFPGTRYVFVRKEGFRFTGTRLDGDADDLTITLRESAAPPPAWKPGPSATYDEQRAFARRILIRIWEKYGANADNPGAFRCIDDMATIDPDLAMRWSATKGHTYDDRVRHAEARKLAETDAAEALALLNQKPDSDQSILQALADRFAETDPAKALRFAEEAAVQARGLKPPDRTTAMALAGGVLVKLGRTDAGRKLIEEAARNAAHLPSAGRSGFDRGTVARFIAPFDLKQALALIEPIQNEGTQRAPRFRAEIAVAIAATDTKQAVALIDGVGGPAFFHEMGRSAIAYRIGADRPDEAIKIIEGIRRNRWAPQWQAGAFGWLAVALAPRDRARACSLIDRALMLTIERRDWMGPGHEMAIAARVAACARRIGYPDMDSVIARVMAARPGDRRDGSSDRARLIESLTTAAVPLALIDPAAARTVLEQVESRSGLDPATLWNTRGPWLTAWALVDLKKAGSIFDAMMTALDGAKEVDLWNSGFYQMIELLAAPPDRREDVLGESARGGFWQPGSDL